MGDYISSMVCYRIKNFGVHMKMDLNGRLDKDKFILFSIIETFALIIVFVLLLFIFPDIFIDFQDKISISASLVISNAVMIYILYRVCKIKEIK